MEIALAPDSASRIRAVLGDSVDLSPAAVPQALARLAGEAPDVYSEVLEQLSGSDIRLDSERALHRRHKRTALRRALFGWGEYESDAGDRLLAKRRVAAAVPVALAAIMLLAAGVSALLNRPHPASTLRAAPVLRPFPESVREETTAVRRGAARESSLWPPRSAVRRVFAAVPEPMPVRSSPQLPPVPALPLPPVLSGAGAAEGALPPAIVFSREPGSSVDPTPSGDAVPRSPVVYARDAAADTGQPPAPRPDAVAEARELRSGTPPKVGDRIAARLVTGVIVAAGVPPVPVIAEGVDGSTWLGHATAESDGRVYISFQATNRESRRVTTNPPAAGVTPASGVALEPERLTAGLSGRVVIRRRAAAAAAIGAVLRAVSDYMRALARAGQVTVADGVAQLWIGGPAPGWTYAAARLAEMLNPQTAATIETFEVPPGARCVILITEAS